MCTSQLRMSSLFISFVASIQNRFVVSTRCELNSIVYHQRPFCLCFGTTIHSMGISSSLFMTFIFVLFHHFDYLIFIHSIDPLLCCCIFLCNNCSMLVSTVQWSHQPFAIELCGPGIVIVVATAIGNADEEDIACVTS